MEPLGSPVLEASHGALFSIQQRRISFSTSDGESMASLCRADSRSRSASPPNKVVALSLYLKIKQGFAA